MTYQGQALLKKEPGENKYAPSNLGKEIVDNETWKEREPSKTSL